MRPLKLIMTAFGPYKHEETIDFTKLYENRLFVVSGKTGAGKTTIFDAICFALYGVASGEDREDSKMLRSQFAEDDVHTSVRLEFELKGKTYSIFRQLAHVKQGNKSATGDDYEFFDITNEEKIPLCNFKVTSVNQKIEETIGLTKEQFSQIVMLPQGEFRKLLTSKTVDKEEILRRIFKTTVYKSIVEKMNERRKVVQKEYEENVKERDVYINGIKASLPHREGTLFEELFKQEHLNSHQVLEALSLEKQFYQDEKKESEGLLKKEIEKLNKITVRLHQGEATNARFAQLEEKKAENHKLDSMKGEMLEKEKQLDLAEQASRIEPYENQVNIARQEVTVKAEVVETTKVKAESAKATLHEVKKAYEAENGRKPEREQIQEKINHLTQWLPTVESFEQKKKELASLAKEAETKNKAFQVIEKGYKAKQREKQERTEIIKSLEGKVKNVSEKQEKLMQMREKVKVLKKFISMKNEVEKLEGERKEKQKDYEIVHSAYQEIESRWFEGQASILAEHLHDGKECPVCGSSDHPKLAKKSHDVPTKEMLDQKRNQRENIQNQLAAINAKYDSAITQLLEIKDEGKSYELSIEHADEQYKALVTEGKQLSEEVNEMKKNQQSLEQQKELLHLLEKEIDKRQHEKEELFTITNELKGKHSTEKALLEQSIANVPNELRSLTELQQKLTMYKEKKAELEAAWENIQKALDKAKEENTAASINYQNAEKSLNEAKAKYENNNTTFNEMIVKSGFKDVNEYLGAKLSDENRSKLKEEINLYNTNCASVKKMISELAEELKNKELVQLETLKEQHVEQNSLVEQRRDAMQKIVNYEERANEAYNQISTTSEKVGEIEKEFQRVKGLYDVIRGENDKRISFERYLQIEFLEQIIQLANERLKQLSNGQFTLVRSDRIEKNKVQSGLGLDVYDNYTGQLRDVKTLSGGEKFNASLCLALGMADVIQSYEGGISIEMMFIDEGFGSLDEESLTKAIDTLIDLQKTGRMIGVISHVQELKQAIPAILEVSKTKEGYSKTSFEIR